MIESINSYLKSTEKPADTSMNFAINKTPVTSIFENLSGSGKLCVVTFDWLKMDKQLKEHLPDNSSLGKILNLNVIKVQKVSPSITEKEREKAIEEEKRHISKIVTVRTAYNTKQLKSAGVPERQIYKYLTYDGHVNDEGKRILKAHGKNYK